MSFRHWIFFSFLLAGCWQLGEVAWIHAKAWLAEQLIADAWTRTDSPGERVPPWSWADTWPVAHLEAPRLGVTRYILSGGHGRALAFGPGWLESTTLPGGVGKTAISGHRDTHFRFLRQLELQDRILVRLPGGKSIEYLVESMEIHHETESWLLEAEDRQQLLLITCYPFDTLLPETPWRFVVTAGVEVI